MTNDVKINAPEGQPFIEIEREFEAPTAAVFRAHQDPELNKQWVGPDGYEMTIERHDFVSQGSYRFGHTTPDGNEYWYNGVFHTVRENEFTIRTFEFEGVPDQVSLEVLTFTDLGDGRTRLTGRSIFPSVESRDGMVESGMERGVVEGYARLDVVLASEPAS